MFITWQKVFDDLFNRADASSLGNGWLDPNGAAKITAGRAQWVYSGADAYHGPGWVGQPASLTPGTDQRFTLKIPAQAVALQSYYGILAGQGDPSVATTTANGILIGLDPGNNNQLQAFGCTGGTNLSSGGTAPLSAAYDPTHDYLLDGNAVKVTDPSTGAISKTLTYSLTDLNTNQVVASGTGSITDSVLMGTGFVGFFSERGQNAFTEFSAYVPQAAVSPTPTPTPTTFGPASSACWLSPFNWDDDGTGSKQVNGARPGAAGAWATPPGAEFRYGWATSVATGNVATIGIDTSHLVAANVASDQYPVLFYWINDGAAHVQQVGPGTGGVYAIDLTGAGVSGAGTYQLHGILLRSSLNYSRWTATSGVVPDLAFKIGTLTVDAGSTAVAPTFLGKILLLFGDSITEGVRVLGTPVDFTAADSTLAYGRALAAGLGAELGVVGYGAQGWEKTGIGNVPTFPNAWQLYGSGRNRDFTPAVDYVVCTHGANDGLNNVADASVTADSAAWLAAARAKFGSTTKIFLCVPFGGFKRSALTAGFQQYQAATPDASTYLIDGGIKLQAGLTGFVTGGTKASPADGVHPGAATDAQISATVLELMLAAMGSSSVSGGGGLTAGEAAQLNDVQAKLTTLAGLFPSSMFTANGIKADVEAIAGNVAAAQALEVQSLATDFPDSMKSQLRDLPWSSSQRTITAFGFQVALTGSAQTALATTVAAALPTLSLDGGAVVASPAPSPLTFSASGANLTAASGGYLNQKVMFQTGALTGLAREIVGHVVTGTGPSAVHTFTLAPAPAAPFPSAPASADAFTILT